MTVLGRICISLIVIAALAGIYAYRNMTYDRRALQQIQKARVTEKQAVLPDGSVLNFGEGPDGAKKPPLLLLHGQNVSWEDYAPVLPALVREYHVYAVDCYGHGGSSKNPDKYSAEAIGADLIWFLKNVIGQPAVVSGHSSGGLLAAWLAANAPDQVRGAVIEDAPFFSTEPGRAESTFAGKTFKIVHDFLNQTDEPSYTAYNLEHNYMQTLFNKGGTDNWARIVKNPALHYMQKHPGELPRIWYYPQSLGVNNIYDLTANMQDGTGDYDLRFGETFYNYSWFKNFNQSETLARVTVPTTILHVAAPRTTAPSYYDSNGVLLAAMDEEDAAKATSLIRGAELVDGFESQHDIHQDQPEAFIKALIDFKERVGS